MKSKKSRTMRKPPSNRLARKSVGGPSTAKTKSRATIGGPAAPPFADSADALTAKMDATEALAAGMPYNANKALEHGKAAYKPPVGQTVEPEDPAVTSSTLTESNASDKAGSGEPQFGSQPRQPAAGPSPG